jgi:imidazolonepropionase-like amidohydrolase
MPGLVDAHDTGNPLDEIYPVKKVNLLMKDGKVVRRP